MNTIFGMKWNLQMLCYAQRFRAPESYEVSRRCINRANQLYSQQKIVKELIHKPINAEVSNG